MSNFLGNLFNQGRKALYIWKELAIFVAIIMTLIGAFEVWNLYYINGKFSELSTQIENTTIIKISESERKANRKFNSDLIKFIDAEHYPLREEFELFRLSSGKDNDLTGVEQQLADIYHRLEEERIMREIAEDRVEFLEDVSSRLEEDMRFAVIDVESPSPMFEVIVGDPVESIPEPHIHRPGSPEMQALEDSLSSYNFLLTDTTRTNREVRKIKRSIRHFEREYHKAEQQFIETQ